MIEIDHSIAPTGVQGQLFRGRVTTSDWNSRERVIMQTFPGWRCFFGPKTRKWWGLPPSRDPVQVLLEADTPEHLAVRIHHACAHPRT
jgi:hypothetical protein